MTMPYETTMTMPFGRRESMERQGKVVRMMALALSRSRSMGHSPVRAVTEDNGKGAVSYCTGCGLYICVDLDESREPYGSAYTQPCTRDRKGKRR